jgi:hypothetical protein
MRWSIARLVSTTNSSAETAARGLDVKEETAVRYEPERWAAHRMGRQLLLGNPQRPRRSLAGRKSATTRPPQRLRPQVLLDHYLYGGAALINEKCGLFDVAAQTGVKRKVSRKGMSRRSSFRARRFFGRCRASEIRDKHIKGKATRCTFSESMNFGRPPTWKSNSCD